MNKRIVEISAAVMLALTTVLALIAFIGYKKVDQTLGLMQRTDKEEIKEMTNPNISNDVVSTLKENWTVALFGLDTRDTDGLSGANSDVIILASINNKTGDINLISVYRDTCLKTGDNRYRKVNEAYAIGGPKKAVEVLNENLDLEIDDYVAVNWKAVATAINILGGVDIEITKDELKYINGYITETVNSTGIGSYQIHEAGMQHLDGIQAVAYSRIRYTAGNDYKRTERQRTVLAAVLEKAKHSDWSTLNNVIVTVFPMTSSSIDTNDVITVAMNVANYKLIKTGGFPFDVIEKSVDKQDYVFPDTLETNVSKLHEFLYGTDAYTPSDKISSISNKIDNKRLGSKRNISSTIQQETMPTEVNNEPETEEAMSQTVAIVSDETEENMDNMTEPETNIEPEVGPGIQISTPEEKTKENYGPGFEIEIEETEEAQSPS
ncbi:LytR family transcriptional regulator [Enterocloster aldenensis]|uniref:LCP family protein n=1 Tax=Enterocloster aldenensis TaxID=358742 RepID=UPI000E4F83CB|nr:LytR family transcriptional regulator [Enterocloster aldenensis]